MYSNVQILEYTVGAKFSLFLLFCFSDVVSPHYQRKRSYFRFNYTLWLKFKAQIVQPLGFTFLAFLNCTS